MLRAQEDAPGIDGHDTVPVLHRALLDRHTRNDDAGVVDEDIESAVPVERGPCGTLPIRLTAYIEMHVHGVATVGANGSFDLPALGIADIAEHHARAFPGEHGRFHGTLPSRSATDQCHFPVKLSHGEPPVRRRSML